MKIKRNNEITRKKFTSIFKGCKVVKLTNYKETIISQAIDELKNEIETVKIEGYFEAEKENRKPNQPEETNFQKQVLEMLVKMDQKMENRFDKIEGRLVNLESDMVQVKADMVEVKDRLTNLESDMVEVKSDIVEIKGRLTKIENCPTIKDELKQI